MRFPAVAYCSFDSVSIATVPLGWTLSVVVIVRRRLLAVIKFIVARAMAET